jgi:hypothetical protein
MSIFIWMIARLDKSCILVIWRQEHGLVTARAHASIRHVRLGTWSPDKALVFVPPLIHSMISCRVRTSNPVQTAYVGTGEEARVRVGPKGDPTPRRL